MKALVLLAVLLLAARTDLHRPQHLGLVCNPHCRLTGFPSPSASSSAYAPR
jgi:hypothetical protein